MTLRERGYLTEAVTGWMQIKRLIPGVRNPLFIGVGPGKLRRFFERGHLIPNTRSSGPDAVCLTRDFNVAFFFGPRIIVVDRDKLNKAKLKPHAWDSKGWTLGPKDEAEERYYDKIEMRSIAAVILPSDFINFSSGSAEAAKKQVCSFSKLGKPVIVNGQDGPYRLECDV